jgi:serine/threonine protein phosphatase PrpC
MCDTTVSTTIFSALSVCPYAHLILSQEDSLALCGNFADKPDLDFYGLFDGHAGRIAADFVSGKLPEILANKLKAGGEPKTRYWQYSIVHVIVHFLSV